MSHNGRWGLLAVLPEPVVHLTSLQHQPPVADSPSRMQSAQDSLPVASGSKRYMMGKAAVNGGGAALRGTAACSFELQRGPAKGVAVQRPTHTPGPGRPLCRERQQHPRVPLPRRGARAVAILHNSSLTSGPRAPAGPPTACGAGPWAPMPNNGWGGGRLPPAPALPTRPTHQAPAGTGPPHRLPEPAIHVRAAGALEWVRIRGPGTGRGWGGGRGRARVDDQGCEAGRGQGQVSDQVASRGCRGAGVWSARAARARTRHGAVAAAGVHDAISRRLGGRCKHGTVVGESVEGRVQRIVRHGPATPIAVVRFPATANPTCQQSKGAPKILGFVVAR